MNRLRMIEVCKMIAADAEADSKRFEGAEFNGRNVSTLFGNQGAAIASLARMVSTILADGQSS